MTKLNDTDYFAGKHVVVTGAASGIGLALIEALLSRGAATAVMADVNEAALFEQAKRLESQYPGRVKGIACDVTNPVAVADIIAQSVRFGSGRIDLLINNAGKTFGGELIEQSDEGWKEAFDLNFYAALNGARAAIPVMKSSGGGQIVNIISGIAFAPLPYQTRYAASKAALHALSVSMRSELADDNIMVNSATPGTTATTIWKNGAVPDFAQSAADSASHILAGVEANQMLILGDAYDRKLFTAMGNPENHGEADAELLKIARARRRGEMGF